MEGYRLTRKGMAVLVVILLVLAISLFGIGTLFSGSFQAIVDGPLLDAKGTSTGGDTVPPTQETTQTATVTEANLEVTEGNQTSTVSADIETSTKPATSSPNDLVKMATIVYFKPDSAALDEAAYKALSAFVETAKSITDLPIVIEGHAEALSEVTTASELLARKRAQAIQAYLIEKGVAKERIVITSLVGTSASQDKQHEVWKSLRAEIYYQGYPTDK